MPDTTSSSADAASTPAGIPSPVDYNSPKDLAALLETLGLAMRKKFGQNFLISSSARRRIVELLDPQPGLRTWEIGPGTGAMTREALLAGLSLTTFEIDKGFADFIRRSYGDTPCFELYEGDFVRTWRTAVEASGIPGRVFGNLPYNAAGAIIAALIEGGVRPQRMVFTVQKEAGLRMAASPGTKNYSAFSVLCRSAYRVKPAFDLSPGSFWPQPRVISSVMLMEARKDPIPFAGDKKFTNFVRSAFSSRRKTLRNNMKAAGHSEELIVEACTSIGIVPNDRAETLTPEQFAQLYLAFGL